MRSMLNQLIERMYFRGLVFNQSWEDPTLDRESLQISADQDTVLSITSGGCNCLNLLCLRPRRLICVDANPAQTYLLELKLAGIRYLDYGDFHALFGSPAAAGSVAIYRDVLRPRLPTGAGRYWDSNIHMLERGLLSQGKLGFFLRWFRRYLRWRVGEQRIRQLFTARNLDEQRSLYYSEIHPRLWRGPLLKILSTRPVLAFAGMHPSQYELIRSSGGVERYVRDRVEHLLTCVPIRDNYFVAQASLGTYLDAKNVPPYLLEENFPTLKQMVDRVVNTTSLLSDYLGSLPEGSIDKFNLLDIFDWMDQETFRATMGEVLRVGTHGGRFIYRSTVRSRPVPEEYRAMAASEEDLARELFARDRSGTYGSFYVYRIDKSGLRSSPADR
jgi:S-adenosylmethionine-diacylglycerol 3-amino-3-carboxypropyl transferase